MMLPFFLGLAASVFLFLAKYGLVKIILYKKNHLFWIFLTLFGELSIFALIYTTLSVLHGMGEEFIYGFLTGLVTLVLFYVISYTLKKSNEAKEGQKN